MAGPTEIVIIAEDADPRHVAADMLAQAEHVDVEASSPPKLDYFAIFWPERASRWRCRASLKRCRPRLWPARRSSP